MRDVQAILAKLEGLGDPEKLKGRSRFGLPEDNTFGVRMPDIRALAKNLGRDHGLALALWATGQRDAMTLAPLVDEPAKVDMDQMESWALAFDNWGICDTCCMNLFDRTKDANHLAKTWADREEEFVKRAAFATMAALAVHDKKAADAPFMEFLTLIEREARDERNMVKKAVNWALRQIGKRNMKMNTAALGSCRRILAQNTPPARWIARDAIRELESEKIRKRLVKRS